MANFFQLDESREGGERISANATAAAAAREAFSVQAQHESLANAAARNALGVEAQHHSLANAERGTLPACFLAFRGPPESESAPKRVVVRTYRYPDGTKITDYANGDSVKANRDGHKVTTKADGTMIFQDKEGRVNMVISKEGIISQFDHNKGTKSTEYPDGRVVIQQRDGTKTELHRNSLHSRSVTRRK